VNFGEKRDKIFAIVLLENNRVAPKDLETNPLTTESKQIVRKVGSMVHTLISVDPKKLPWEQETPLHNRWHPDIPPVAAVKEGEVFRVECVDWTGGQIKNNDSSDDVKNVDLSQVHYLSGPIEVEGAEPGDLLKVELLNLGTLDGDEWGFTGSFAREWWRIPHGPLPLC
jgi:hypothetical protein